MITEREKFAGRTTNHESKLPNGKPMTREDIIRMAREAGFTAGEVAHMGDNFIRFAEIVAAHEREECAKVCDDARDNSSTLAHTVCINLARRIRERGEK